MGRLPKRQRVSAYAVIIRGDRVLLTRLAPRVSRNPLWTLPGGGVEHGEEPRRAVVREVHEETGLPVTVGQDARVYSLHNPRAAHRSHTDYHALRLVFEGWVPKDAPDPHVVEEHGSTMDAAWQPIDAVLSGDLPVTSLVSEALAGHEPFRQQRCAAYGLVRQADQVLLTRISSAGFHVGSWTLPGGGVHHGEHPRDTVVREIREECGLDAEAGSLLGVHDSRFAGTAPNGRHEDFHGIHLVFAASVPADSRPTVVETDGTTDAVRWIRTEDVATGEVEVLDVVRYALDL